MLHRVDEVSFYHNKPIWSFKFLLDIKVLFIPAQYFRAKTVVSEMEREGGAKVSDIERVRNLEPTIQANAIRIEIEDFEQRLKHLFEGGMTSNRTDETIEAKYQYLLTQWREIKGLINTSQFDSVDYQVFDSFVEQIDQLVSQLQLASEKKLI